MQKLIVNMLFLLTPSMCFASDNSIVQEEEELVRALALSRITPEQEEQEILEEVARFKAKTERQNLVLTQDQAYYGGLYQDEAKELIPQLSAEIIVLEETINQMGYEHTQLINDIRRADQSERLQRQLPTLHEKLEDLEERQSIENSKLILYKQQLEELLSLQTLFTVIEPES